MSRFNQTPLEIWIERATWIIVAALIVCFLFMATAGCGGPWLTSSPSDTSRAYRERDELKLKLARCQERESVRKEDRP